MSSQSILSVCNLALLSIGSQSQISSLNEGTPQSNACSQYFSFVYEALARTAYWNCLRKQATLSLLAASAGTPENPQGTTLPLPPTPWLYMYQLPSDCLQARFIVPTFPNATSTGISPIPASFLVNSIAWGVDTEIPFHVAYATDNGGNPIQVVLTNQTQAQLVYTVNQPNPQIWDSQFRSAMVAALAAYLVPALALNLPLANLMMQKAEGIIMQARVRDANEGSNSQDHIPDFIRARNGGGTYVGNYPNNWGWDAMVWPV